MNLNVIDVIGFGLVWLKLDFIYEILFSLPQVIKKKKKGISE